MLGRLFLKDPHRAVSIEFHIIPSQGSINQKSDQTIGVLDLSKSINMGGGLAVGHSIAWTKISGN